MPQSQHLSLPGMALTMAWSPGVICTILMSILLINSVHVGCCLNIVGGPVKPSFSWQGEADLLLGNGYLEKFLNSEFLKLDHHHFRNAKKSCEKQRSYQNILPSALPSQTYSTTTKNNESLLNPLTSPMELRHLHCLGRPIQEEAPSSKGGNEICSA